MPNWYRAGSISVNTNATVVNGAGTDFVSNVLPGEGMLLPDGRVHEIDDVISATQVTIVDPYVGGNVTGAAYAVFPTTGIDRELVDGVRDILNTFGSVRDTIGQGLIADGTVSVPGVRFTNDQDTGVFRLGANELGISTGGAARLRVSNTYAAADVRISSAPDLTGHDLSFGGSSLSSTRSAVSGQHLTMTRAGNHSWAIGYRYNTNDFAIGLSQTNDSNFSNPFFNMTPAGNVGIGITTPLSKLDIAGVGRTMIGEVSDDPFLHHSRWTGSGTLYYQSRIRTTIGGGATALIFETAPSADIGAASFSERMRISQLGNVGIGITNPVERLEVAGNIHIQKAGGSSIKMTNSNYNVEITSEEVGAAAEMAFRTNNSEKMRIDQLGNLLVGAASASNHIIRKAVASGADILTIDNASVVTAVFFGTEGSGYNAAAAGLKVGHCSTSRSINASGTINASGADYAEYMTKADGCGEIAKGDVCGVDAEGKLTRKWADAISFVVKSTDPAYVGGDRWGDIGERPQPPIKADNPNYNAELAAYEDDLEAFENALEEARSRVDRIAFSGQVPINVEGDFTVGDYIIAAANHGGIKGVAVNPNEITLPQYMKRVGKVWAIRDGKAWCDVQHG